MAGPSREQYQAGMGITFMYSLLFHVVIVIIAIVGLPHLKTREYRAPQPISIEIAMIDDVIKTTKPPKEIKKPEPKKDKKPVKTPPKADKPKPSPTVKADKPPKEVKPEIVKKTEVKTTPPPKKTILKKPKIKKPKPKKDKKAEPDYEAFASILKNLAPEEEQSDPENTQQGQMAQVITASELSAVSKQIGGCWNLLPGARDADLLTVELRIKVFPDRTVKSVDIMDKFRYQNNPFFRAAADNAVRAIRNPACSPLNLPLNKYDLWKDMIFNFDPRGMF